MLYVNVNGKLRRVLYTIDHPSGKRYKLLPKHGEPETVAVATIEKTPWNKRIKNPDPLPRLVS